MRHLTRGSRFTAAALAACLLFATAPVHGQASLLFTPQPLRTSRSLGIKNVGLWTVEVCNDSDKPLSIPQERILMAAPALWALDHATALAMLQQNRVHEPHLIASTLLQQSLILATVLVAGGMITASARALASLTIGSTAVQQVAGDLKGQIPDLTGIQNNLLEPSLSLAPGACATRTVLGGLHKGATAIPAKIH